MNPTSHWIPAFAGMTAFTDPARKMNFPQMTPVPTKARHGQAHASSLRELLPSQVRTARAESRGQPCSTCLCIRQTGYVAIPDTLVIVPERRRTRTSSNSRQAQRAAWGVTSVLANRSSRSGSTCGVVMGNEFGWQLLRFGVDRPSACRPRWTLPSHTGSSRNTTLGGP